MAPGLYIHIPFCIQKCRYCDFYSVTDRSLSARFCESLQQEMGLAAAPSDPFDTFYMGGGTPSVLESTQIGDIMAAAFRHFSFTEEPEITIEANPGTLGLNKCRDYRSMGINRLQIGVQSFNDRHLNLLGRIHSADEAIQAIQDARAAGFTQIGMDIIYGIPGQTVADLLEDLRQAAAFEPEHISCYMLTCEPGTPLDQARKRREFKLIPEDDMADRYLTVVEFLNSNGYDQYEISNFAVRRDGRIKSFRSRHNRKYWRLDPYLGLGPSAHSFFPPERRWNHRSLESYLHAISRGQAPVEGSEILTQQQQMMEAVLLGLRTSDGISVSEFRDRFRRDITPIIQKALQEPFVRERAMFDGDRFRLYSSGMLVMDAITDRMTDEFT